MFIYMNVWLALLLYFSPRFLCLIASRKLFKYSLFISDPNIILNTSSLLILISSSLKCLYGCFVSFTPIVFHLDSSAEFLFYFKIGY